MCACYTPNANVLALTLSNSNDHFVIVPKSVVSPIESSLATIERRNGKKLLNRNQVLVGYYSNTNNLKLEIQMYVCKPCSYHPIKSTDNTAYCVSKKLKSSANKSIQGLATKIQRTRFNQILIELFFVDLDGVYVRVSVCVCVCVWRKKVLRNERGMQHCCRRIQTNVNKTVLYLIQKKIYCIFSLAVDVVSLTIQKFKNQIGANAFEK